MSRFEEFWEAWPSPKDPRYRSYKRKTDKKKCREIWETRKYDDQASVIIRDVEQRAKYDKGWLQQEGEFLSAPLVYLRNERWDGSEYADIRDDKKKSNVVPIRQHMDQGPELSRYARFANLALLKKLLVIGGTGSEPDRPSEAVTRAVRAKNEVVRQAEVEQWDNEDFKSVIFETINGALKEAQKHRAV